MGAEDLFQQRGARARMPAQKRQPVRDGRRRRALRAPAPDRFGGQRGEQLAPAADRPVVFLLHFGHVGRPAQPGLGLAQPAHGLRVLAELIQHHGQLMAAGIIHIGIRRCRV